MDKHRPHSVPLGGAVGAQPRGPQQTPVPAQALPSPLIKEQPVVTTAPIYLIKMGYSGAVLWYVNECYIVDIY